MAVEEPNAAGLFSINFNQDNTSIGIGTKFGYKLFTINTVEKIEQICDNVNEDTCILERLFSSSLVAIVSLSSPRKLKVCHFKKQSEICNYSYPNTILSVKLNRARLLVCLEESLYIHNIRDMKVLHTIRDTPPNPSGLFCLSTSSDNNYMAYPGSNAIGQVQIFDTLNLQAKTMIPAHDSPLAAMAFDEAGTKIATASEKGTVIRVFNVIDGTKLHELRRGMKRCATIYSLSFSSNSLYIVCSSNTETVHIFKLETVKEAPPQVVEEPTSLIGWAKAAVTASASYLPAPVTDILSQGRAFATVSLPFSNQRTTCAITNIERVPHVIIASSEGFVYIYDFSPEKGGECALKRQHQLPITPGATFPAKESSPVTPATATHPGTAHKAVGDYNSSYAKAVQGKNGKPMTESDCLNQMAEACESPPKMALNLDDESEYPAI